MAHSCDWCSQIVLDSRLRTEVGSDGVELNSRLVKDHGSEVYRYKSMIKFRGTNILQGLNAGCSFFKNALVGSRVRPDNAEDWIYEISFYPSKEERTHDIFIGSGVWSSANGTRIEGGTYGIMAEPNDPAAGYIQSRPLNWYPASGESIKWINARIAECDESHSSCAPRKTSVKAARLLRIIPDGKALRLRLCSATGLERYSALSYCWGTVQHTQLTSSLCELWGSESGFSVDQLPASLADAVYVSRKIGLDYIWIDSLCIIQSDTQDKATEVSKMAAIYEGAFITISAGSAKSCTSGFLHQLICPNPSAGSSFRIPYICPDGTMGSVILCATRSFWVGDPIDRRAWTMQEHILSRRTVRFGGIGLQWACCNMVRFFPDGDIGVANHRHQTVTQLSGLNQAIRNKNDRTLALWTDIVNEFTDGRSLTEKEDQLPALTGIATRWNELSDDTYLAGIWLSHLPQGLLWLNAKPCGRNSGSYSAPTWSWACLEEPSIQGFLQYLPPDAAFRLLDYRIELEFPEFLYGKIKNGSITVQGKVIPMLWSPKDYALKLAEPDLGYLNPDFAKVYIDVWKDIKEDDKGGQQHTQVWLLQLVIFDGMSQLGPAGLILERVESDHYRRLGIYYHDHRRGLTMFEDRHGSQEEGQQSYEVMIEEQRNSYAQLEPTILTII